MDPSEAQSGQQLAVPAASMLEIPDAFQTTGTSEIQGTVQMTGRSEDQGAVQTNGTSENRAQKSDYDSRSSKSFSQEESILRMMENSVIRLSGGSRFHPWRMIPERKNDWY
jgi:hypothetical protein